eukprot:gene11020-3726_t
MVIDKDIYTTHFSTEFPNQKQFYFFIGTNRHTPPPSDNSRLSPLDALEIIPFDLNQKTPDCYVSGVRRWSSFHLSIYILELLFYLLMTLITLLMYIFKMQPLYSRGFTPVLGCIAQIFSLLGELYIFTLTVEENIKYTCLFNMFFYYSGNQLALILMPIHMFRHLAVVALSKTKGQFYITKRKVVEGRITYIDVAKWPIVLLKIIQNPVLNAIISISYFIILVLIQSIIYIIALYTGPSNNGCFDSYIPVQIVQSSMVIILIFIWVAALIIDFIMTIPETVSCKEGKFKCNPLSIFGLFLKRDPLAYRFEMYILGPIVVLLFVVFSILILSIDIEKYRGLYVTIYSIFAHTLFFYQILRKICGKKLKSIEEIDLILMDKTPRGGYQLFSQFAADEYSIENIAIWEDTNAYRQETDPEKRKKLAIQIYGTYLDGANSPLEVNVSFKTRSKLKKAEGLGSFETDLFNGVMQEIKANMVDTYSRFQVTPGYLQYLSKNRFKQEMGLVDAK